MKSKDLMRMGVPAGAAVRAGMGFIESYVAQGMDTAGLEAEIGAVIAGPRLFVEDALRGRFAKELIASERTVRQSSAPCHVWGEGLGAETVLQMERACGLSVAVAGALMPDAHVGYGLPIGGVLAAENAVIPYAVGVDIACRMKLTVMDVPVDVLKEGGGRERLAAAIQEETRFGVGAAFSKRREHEVLEADWSVSPVTARSKDRAWAQLGTSGSGNHFVEFGVFTAMETVGGLGPGEYVALLSHSGSRGSGAAVCDHYSKLAMAAHANLPREYARLAWLDLDSDEGREYWAAMELMGRYAAANHELIHRYVGAHLGARALFGVENHHNFAWKERHVIDGLERDVVVHRKGATPAGAGVLGVIPGSMASPGFLVRGKGNVASLKSASHGAGRAMSRKMASGTLNWEVVRRELEEGGVTLMSGGLDEAPGAYKDIHRVMEAQTDLVEVLGRFDPKVVKMAPTGERPED